MNTRTIDLILTFFFIKSYNVLLDQSVPIGIVSKYANYYKAREFLTFPFVLF
jgi:hypothetical protein